MNTAECAQLSTNHTTESASMEPPCEHGGVLPVFIDARRYPVASMEPPCEHGGVA